MVDIMSDKQDYEIIEDILDDKDLFIGEDEI